MGHTGRRNLQANRAQRAISIGPSVNPIIRVMRTIFHTLSRKCKTNRQVLAALLLIVVTAHLIPVLFHDLVPGQDWAYFNSFNLLVRSSVLHYHTFPLHDPWLCGGSDLLANPQTRVFSPNVLFDILLPPHLASLATIVLYGLLGALGAYLFLRERLIDRRGALVGSAMFINASWFALHFSEGHVAYGQFQLFFWVLYFGLSLDNPRRFFALCSLLTFFLLDGALYPFIFSAMMLASCLAVGLGAPWQRVGLAVRQHWRTYAVSVISTILLASAKLIPALLANGMRKPRLDFIRIEPRLLLHFLFNPFISVKDSLVPLARTRDHEFGCYLGLSVVAALLIVACRREARPKAARWALVALFWLWVGSGLGWFNPWTIFQKLPVIQHAHMQSRVFIIAFTALVVIVAHALHSVRFNKPLHAALTLLVLVESLVAHTYPLANAYQQATPEPIGNRMISSTTIETTILYGYKPQHYLEGNKGTNECYEHATQLGFPTIEDSLSYKGEAYIAQGDGTVKLTSYVPGVIQLDYNVTMPSLAVINSAFLFGWSSDSPGIVPYQAGSGLIGLRIGHGGTGRVTLTYTPSYFTTMLLAFLAGFVLWSFTGIGLFREYTLRLRPAANGQR